MGTGMLHFSYPQQLECPKAMANSLSLSPLLSLNSLDKPGLISRSYITRKANWIDDASYSCRSTAFRALKATENKSGTKPNSLVCVDCEGNGAKKCSQCKGTGVNSVDHFNGQYKAGAVCWLCRGRKEILCGNCNGAGFMGGFMSTLED